MVSTEVQSKIATLQGPQKMAKKIARVLEINLISAQGLRMPSTNFRRIKTYAVIWVDPSTKVRTRVDRVGGENPTWNDKFLFRVTPEFLSSETSGATVEIYVLGRFRDDLIGTVRFLISRLLCVADTDITPSFAALQIRRPSGKFEGVLNVGTVVIEGSEFAAAMNGISTIGFSDLLGKGRHWDRQERKRQIKSKENFDEFSRDSWCDSSDDDSDDDESTTSSSSTTSTALKDGNAVKDFPGNKDLKVSNSVGFLCGLLSAQKKTQQYPYDRRHSLGGICLAGIGKALVWDGVYASKRRPTVIPESKTK